MRLVCYVWSATELHTLEAKIKIPNTNIQFDRAIDHGTATLTTFPPHLTYQTAIIVSSEWTKYLFLTLAPNHKPNEGACPKLLYTHTHTSHQQCAKAANKNPVTTSISGLKFSFRFSLLFVLFNFHALGWFRYRT